MLKIVYQGRNNHVQAYCTSFLVFPQSVTHGYGGNAVSFKLPVMVSIAGPVMACRAIAAALVTHERLTIEDEEGKFVSIQKETYQEFRLVHSQIQNGVHHILAVDARALPSLEKKREMIVIGAPGQPPEEALFNAIRRNTSTPLLPQWAGDLLNILQEKEIVTKLEGKYSGPAMALFLSNGVLDRTVAQAVKEGRLAF